jgi:hypothetical protein
MGRSAPVDVSLLYFADLASTRQMKNFNAFAGDAL